jgi:MFS transporter, DHA2 family, multidrug resistance protein
MSEMAPPQVNKWMVALSVTFGTLMGALDASIVAVAVPHLRGSLGATVEEITWVTTGYVIAMIVIMPLTAFLGRQLGQKRLYMGCLTLFLIGSALCGTARSLNALLAFRVIQGLGAGALQPSEQAILRQTFPLREQGMAMAIFGVAVGIGPTLGPTLGGLIIDHYSWPWIFYINLPVGALALLMVSRFVHVPEDIVVANRAVAEKQRKYLDWIGILLLTAGLAALQYVLEEGNRDDWFESTNITAAALLAGLFLSTFVVRELTAPVPVVDLSLFKDSVFLSGTMIGAAQFAVMMGVTFLLPVFLQELLGYTATQSGLAIMPRSLIMLLVTPIVGKLYNVFPPRTFVIIGILLVALSAYEMSHYTLETSSAGITAALLYQGVGFSCLFTALTTIALSTIPRHKLADATGLNSLARSIGGSLGLAVFVTLLSRYATGAGTSLAAHLVPGRDEVARRLGVIGRTLVGKGFDEASARTAATRIMGLMLTRQSMVLAFEKMFLTAGLLFLLILPLVLFLRSPRADAVAPRGGHLHAEA